MDCIRFNERMNEALDHSLNDNDAVEFEAHLASCDLCSQEYELFKSIQDNLMSLGQAEHDLPSGFHQQLMNRVADLQEETTSTDTVLPLWKRMNRSYLNVAAMLVFVVVFALIGINNLDSNRKSSDSAMVEETASNEDMTMENAAPKAMMETAPAMDAPESAAPEMAVMMETDEEAASDSAMEVVEVETNTEALLTATLDAATEDTTDISAEDVSDAGSATMKESQLARDNNAPLKSSKSIEGQESLVFSDLQVTFDEQVDLPNFWLYIIGGFVVLMTFGSMLILWKTR